MSLIAAALTLAFIAAPLGARAQFPESGAVANLRQPGTHVQIITSDAPPYGRANLNGKRIAIDCVAIQGQFYLTTLLIPWPTEGVVVVRGRQPGQTLWITILKHPLGKTRMSVRTTPGENWGWCGTGGVSFTEASPATGYIIITP